MKKWDHKTIALTIKDGETLAEGIKRLPAGRCIGMAVVASGIEPNSPVNVSVLDGGNEVIETMNYKFMEKTAGGRWTDSVIPMDFRCDRSLEVRISTSEAVESDFTLDTLFIIKNENYV